MTNRTPKAYQAYTEDGDFHHTECARERWSIAPDSAYVPCRRDGIEVIPIMATSELVRMTEERSGGLDTNDFPLITCATCNGIMMDLTVQQWDGDPND